MDPNLMALLAGGGGAPAPGPMAPPPGMGGMAPQQEYAMDMQGMSPDMGMDMQGMSPDQAMDPMMAGMAAGPGGMPMDMAAGGPMNAPAMPTTDPGQLMALISQMAAQDQQTAMMQAISKTKLMQAQAIQPVAAAMLQQAVSQASTMDMGGGPIGAA